MEPVERAGASHYEEEHLDDEVHVVRLGPDEEQQEEHDGAGGDEFDHMSTLSDEEFGENRRHLVSPCHEPTKTRHIENTSFALSLVDESERW